MEIEAEELNFEDIIYEAEPIHKIQELSYNTLQNYSNQFRMSYINIEKEVLHKKEKTAQIQRFHSFIVRLISMIQPSKIAISVTQEETKQFMSVYYPPDPKSGPRQAAKDKNILVLNKLSTGEEKQLFESVLHSIDHLKRCLLLRESQLGMVLFIQDNCKQYSKDKFMEKYSENFSDILDFVISPLLCFQPINYFVLQKILEKQFVFYSEFAAKSGELKEQIVACENLLSQGKVIRLQSKAKIEGLIRSLNVVASKISTIVDLFPFACIKSKDDLFSKEKTDIRWRRLFNDNIIEFKIYGQPGKVHQSFDNLKANLNIVNAAMNIMSKANQIPAGIKGIGNLFESVGKVLKVALSKSEAHKEAEIMIANPNQKLAKEIWNLPERKEFKAFIELSLPSISFSKQLFIPRLAKTYIDAKMSNKQAQLPDFKITTLSCYFKELIDPQKSQGRVSIRINNFFELMLRQFQQQEKKNMNFIEMKFNEMAKNFKEGVDNIKNKFKKSYSPPKAVIFHIHGGGFISMSSFIHQTYTRTWANNLQVPIVSVDYGKAPEHPYPEGLKDCIEAYLWMLYCMKQLYEFQPEKIVLVGDSAGGNLVASLLNVLIQWDLRVPDGIVMVYPALNLNYFDYSPSLLTALNDMILPHTFLKICLKSYLKDPSYRPDQNYFVSPSLTPVNILKKYPKTRIFVGSKDPFHDDCCRLAEKLSHARPGNVHLTIFQEFPHGFLQFDMKNQPHFYCRQATGEVERALRELLGN